MTRTFKKHLIWPAVAAVGVLSLSACSGDGGDSTSTTSSGKGGQPSATAAAANGDLAIPVDADEETKKKYIEENTIAACMRAEGFTYTPHVAPEDSGAANPVDGEDYASAKKYRQKYGYGLWARVVYRNDPKLNDAGPPNPDSAYLHALPMSQQLAWKAALAGETGNGGCSKKGREKAYGPDKSKAEVEKQAAEERERYLANQQALNGDSQLVALAQSYASCLTKEGINVTTTQPTSIGEMVKFQVGNQQPANPESVGAAQARTKLNQEIGLALKDLACGKDFRAAYFPKYAKHPFEGITG
ncbi:hypothetical protein [Streptomyces sp. NPDC001292]|uniref:hypothetical protein n=1 Tax=Streptomyces sp. NPDC001292 TaxID=3364558 RepID=UPI00369A2D61